MQTEEKVLTGYPSIDKPWLKFYGEEEKKWNIKKSTIFEYIFERNKDNLDEIALL